jgi:hypothetical protein
MQANLPLAWIETLARHVRNCAALCQDPADRELVESCARDLEGRALSLRVQTDHAAQREAAQDDRGPRRTP